MFEDFLKELNLALQAQNIYYTKPILEEYRQKFEQLKVSGKTEFECVIALGDPEEIARKLVGQDYSVQDKIEHNLLEESQKSSLVKAEKPKKIPTKATIICTDIFYMAPITIVSTLCIVALAFLSGLVGFAGASYCIMAWTTFSVLKQQILCFVMAFIGVLMFVGGAYTTVKLVMAIIKSIKNYSKERAEKISLIKGAKGE